MPRSNRPKKPNSSDFSSSTKTHARKPSQTVIYTKRQEILDEDGWTHVVDTARRRQRSSTLTRAANGGLHTGDFEIDGVGYVSRTKEEMGKEVEFWRKAWESEGTSGVLRRLLEGEAKGKFVEVEGEKQDEEVVSENVKKDENEVEQSIPSEEDKAGGETIKEEADQLGSVDGDSKEVSPAEKNNEEQPSTQEPDISKQPTTSSNTPKDTLNSIRQKVDNIIVLGLGSLQSARREGRRATLTQLAALETIIKHFESSKSLKVILQEPHFTPTDIEYLHSFPNYEVVADPVAFSEITDTSLVYAVHCYSQVYKAISEGPRPAVLIGTDMGNFNKFNTSEDSESTQKQLEALIADCEVIDFPQVRHDFSDTKIYWRTQPSRTT